MKAEKTVKTINISDEDIPHEECGIIGIVAKDPSVHVAQTIFQGLMALQHRGQEAAGISIVDANKTIHTYKREGLVFEALTLDVLSKLWGNVGVGHVRYGTAGSGDILNAQPFHYETTQTPPFSLVFNGNITNYQLLKNRHIVNHVDHDRKHKQLLYLLIVLTINPHRYGTLQYHQQDNLYQLDDHSLNLCLHRLLPLIQDYRYHHPQ